jgi:hypothetical protein
MIIVHSRKYEVLILFLSKISTIDNFSRLEVRIGSTLMRLRLDPSSPYILISMHVIDPFSKADESRILVIPGNRLYIELTVT